MVKLLNPSTGQWRWPIVLLLFAVFSVMWTAQIAKASEGNWQGKIEVMPADGLIGNWTVNGRAFVTDGQTEFRQERGNFGQGVCVEVEYVGDAAPFHATKIASKSSDDCGGSATPEETETPDPSTTPEPGNQRERYGRVNSMPVDLVGEWVIGGVTYNATANTEFKQDSGPFGLNVCVKVHYSTSTNPFILSEIETEDNSDCRGPRPTATVTPEDSSKAKARIDSLPADGLLGEWEISGITYAVTTTTRLRQSEGPFVVGACVEVEYLNNTDPRAARKIETERSRDCSGEPTEVPTIVPTVPPGGHPGREFEVYGRVETMPDDLIGTWVIKGITYTTTSDTEFDTDHGAFAVDSCVKLHATSTTTPPTIRELETVSSYRCDGNPDGDDEHEHQGRGELFGVIQSMPMTTTLIGEWNIGGMTFMTDESTEFDQEHGAFDVGVTVKVKFTIDANNVKWARQIETKFANEHHGHDDDGDGSYEGAEGHAYGLIETLPTTTDLIGDWVISGMTYTVSADTRLLTPQGDFMAGAKVKVKYYADQNGDRIARKIQTTNEHSGATDESHAVIYSFVQDMPPTGFVGLWKINDAEFVTTDTTKFNEEHSALSVGAFVKVEYKVEGGVNVVHELEALVPPGAGDDSTVGVIDDNGSSLVAAGVQATTWTIGGKSYVVDAATDLNDLQSALTVGSTAVVNSYTATDGTQVATQIVGITLDNVLFLPVVQQ
ncbi:MAG: DUF5666 domain-containing protein [Caldilineaceae bacterium]